MTKPNYKVIAWGSILLLLALISAYAVEFQVFANTLDAQNLVVKSLLWGLVAGLLLGWQLGKHAGDTLAKFRVWTFCISMLPLFAPLIGSWSNRLPVRHSREVIQVEFFSEKAYAASRFGFFEGEKIEPEGYYIFIFKDGKMERLKSSKPRFPAAERGEMIPLTVINGLFGYEVVCWD
ncbi:MAG: hypothetical protein ACE5FF_09185 [Saprospiraceae bacterium]